MHELSLCRAIAGIVRKHAADRPVRVVHLQVGQLRQVVPETLAYCWTLVSETTDLEGADLRIDSVPARLHCAACDTDETITAPILRCPRCAGTQVRIVSGEEFLITSLELAEV